MKKRIEQVILIVGDPNLLNIKFALSFKTLSLAMEIQ
jgi:hypothetical protein